MVSTASDGRRCALDHALRTPELHGIWGAMTAHERSQMRTVRLRAGNG
jgi:Transcription factor WhiB